MNGRDRFLRSIRFEEVDRPAKTDMFCIVKQAFGVSFPEYDEFQACPASEKGKLIGRCVDLYCRMAEKYDHDALIVWHPFSGDDNIEVIRSLRKTLGNERAIIGFAGAFWGLERIHDHVEFAISLEEDRPSLHADAENFLKDAIRRADELADAGADVIYVPNDVAFNGGPYFSPAVYSDIILPYAQRFYSHTRKLGLAGIYHTDGYIMPLLDMIMDTGADALQSIDPMAGMDIAEVKKRTFGRMALIGNVQCNLLQEGPEEAIRASARRCLEVASPGSGYVFMASNSIFEGMPLENYHIMQDEYERFVSGKASPVK